MNRIFFDRRRRLRNGWWVLIFLAAIAATMPLHRLLNGALKHLDVASAWREPLPVLLTLLATWVCVRLRREPLSSVGYQMDRRWFGELAIGTVIGTGAIMLVTAAILAIGGVRFELDPARSATGLVYGAYMFLFAAMLEENLFRGFMFQRLVDGLGAWPAQLALAALFAIAHWGNPGMEGATMVWASIDIALAAVLLGLAYLRTRSLALPIGIHVGWNWAQGNLLGFDVSGHDQPGWLRPLLLDQPEWLTGGAFGPEASAFAVLVDLLVIALLWRWKGTVRSTPAATAAIEPETSRAAA